LRRLRLLTLRCIPVCGTRLPKRELGSFGLRQGSSALAILFEPQLNRFGQHGAAIGFAMSREMRSQLACHSIRKGERGRMFQFGTYISFV